MQGPSSLAAAYVGFQTNTFMHIRQMQAICVPLITWRAQPLSVTFASPCSAREPQCKCSARLHWRRSIRGQRRPLVHGGVYPRLRAIVSTQGKTSVRTQRGIMTLKSPPCSQHTPDAILQRSKNRFSELPLTLILPDTLSAI